MGAAVIQSGEYKLEIDTGFDSGSFVLDSDLKGVLDNTLYTLGPGTSFADVTTGVTAVNIFRGRRDIGDQFLPGTMSFTLNDQIAYGAFNPFNDANTDPANNQPGLAPMRKVRFYRYNASGVAQSLFQGIIVNYDYFFSMDNNDTVQVFCVDNQYLLAQAELDEWNVTEELSSARVVAMLALPEVDAFQGVGEQSIETGETTLGGSAAYTVPQGTNVQQYLSNILDAEQGRAFVNRSGVFTFQNRIGSFVGTPVASFTDHGDYPYSNLGINFGADKVVNRATVSTLQDPTTPQTVDDAGSQATYFIQSVSYIGSLLHNDAAALELASYLIRPIPTPVFSGLTTEFQTLTTAQRDVVATLDIGSVVSIEKTIQTGINSTSIIAETAALEGIAHEITFSQPHKTTIYTSPTQVYLDFILDSSTLSTIYALT